MSAVALVLEFDLHPGKRDAFLARSKEHRETAIRNEPACQRFDVLASAEEADKVLLYAVFANRSALETHFSLSYTQHYLDSTKPMVAKQRLTLCDLVHA